MTQNSREPNGEAWKLGPTFDAKAMIDVSGGVMNGEGDYNWDVAHIGIPIIGKMSAPEVIAALTDGQKRGEFTQRRIFKIDLTFSVAGVLAVRQRAMNELNVKIDAARKTTTEKLEAARSAAKASQYALAKSSILDAILLYGRIPRSTYDSDPAIRAAIAPFVELVFEYKKPVIVAAMIVQHGFCKIAPLHDTVI